MRRRFARSPISCRAGAAVTSAVLSCVSPQEGAAAARVLMAHNEMIQVVDLERRIRKVDRRQREARAAMAGAPK
jgi:hypothetical protein